jgi:DNA-binding Lrp family transcriptional regulator
MTFDVSSSVIPRGRKPPEVPEMVVAYVMVKAHTGDADRLRDSITDIEGVVEGSIVAGDIDIVAKVQVGSPADVKDVAATHIQGIDGVEDTQTYVAMD